MLKYIISPSWRIHVGFVSNSFQIGMHPIIGSIEHKHSNKASAVNRNQFIHYYVTHIHHNFIHYGIHTIFSLCLALAFHSFLYVCIVLFPSLYFIYVSHCKRSHITFTYYQISISCDCYCLFFFSIIVLCFIHRRYTLRPLYSLSLSYRLAKFRSIFFFVLLHSSI